MHRNGKDEKKKLCNISNSLTGGILMRSSGSLQLSVVLMLEFIGTNTE